MARKAKKHQLSPTNEVEKANVLVEIRNNSMTIQEIRFFSIYLSKINARDLSSRIVRFKLEEFQKIMDLGKLNIKYLKSTIDNLILKPVHIPTGNGGYTVCTIFSECTVDPDPETGEWFVEINAHDKALPLMFNLKSNYFHYQLWNIFRLKSSNQVKLYEILKAHEHQFESKYEVKVSDLRSWLGIEEDEHTDWRNFRREILDVCQEAFKRYTDIYFTYERGHTGRGGKWLSIVFHIKKNTGYDDPVALKDFIQSSDLSTPIDIDIAPAASDEQQLDGQMDWLTEPTEKDRLYSALLPITERLGISQCITDYSLNTFLKSAREALGLDDTQVVIDYIVLCAKSVSITRNAKSPASIITTQIKESAHLANIEWYGLTPENLEIYRSSPNDVRAKYLKYIQKMMKTLSGYLPEQRTKKVNEHFCSLLDPNAIALLEKAQKAKSELYGNKITF